MRQGRNSIIVVAAGTDVILAVLTMALGGCAAIEALDVVDQRFWLHVVVVIHVDSFVIIVFHTHVMTQLMQHHFGFVLGFSVDSCDAHTGSRGKKRLVVVINIEGLSNRIRGVGIRNDRSNFGKFAKVRIFF